MTNARSFSATLLPLLHKSRISQDDIRSLLKGYRPLFLLHLLDNFLDTAQNGQRIHRINPDWQLHTTSVGQRSVLHPIFQNEKLRLFKAAIEPKEFARNVRWHGHVIVHTFIPRAESQHAAPV